MQKVPFHTPNTEPFIPSCLWSLHARHYGTQYTNHNQPAPVHPHSAALYSQQDSYRRCIHDAEHGWFVLELSFPALCICAADGEPYKHVFLIPHNPHCQPEKKVNFRNFEHKITMFVGTDYRSSQGFTRAFKRSQKETFRWMLSTVLKCFQLQFL